MEHTLLTDLEGDLVNFLVSFLTLFDPQTEDDHSLFDRGMLLQQQIQSVMQQRRDLYERQQHGGIIRTTGVKSG